MELKFKAKVNNEVVYSNGFMKHIDGTIIVITKQNTDDLETSPIDKDTLCQFTGVKDKNKKDIYNKDILTDGKITYKVEYNTQNTGFFLNPISEDILDTIDYQKLGNGYYSRKDLVIVEPTE
tara:strand:+ start:566 stop:931 length:366 start_codon:yes stop_codon:yes gene_type:complete